MSKRILTSRHNTELRYDARAKKIELIKKTDSSILMQAYFFYDNADGTALLSHFQGQSTKENFARIVADMVSDFLTPQRDKYKLFCYVGEYESEFIESKDYRTTDIDRLMLREENTVTTKIILPLEIKIHLLNSKTMTAENIDQITTLLKNNAYWAKEIDDHYTRYITTHSECVIAIDSQHKIIGLSRFISNQHIAYVADTVVDAAWQGKQIGTALMQYLCQLIDAKKHALSLLISAKKGSGGVAAPKLYTHMGFKDDAQGHQQTIYFRYIKK